MMQANIDRRFELVGKAAGGSDPVVNAQVMLTKLQSEVTGYRTTLWVQTVNSLGSLMNKQPVDAGSIPDAATEFYVRAINLSGKGLETTLANMGKRLDPIAKKIISESTPII